MASRAADGDDLAGVARSLRARVQYLVEMGLGETLIERGQDRPQARVRPAPTVAPEAGLRRGLAAGEAEPATEPAPSTRPRRRPREDGGGGAPLPDTLEELARHLEGCTRCPLHEGRKNVVFGQGNPEARLAFVGEGPGRDEDIQGLAFVGAAGQLLTKIIEAINLRREDVYICNVVKCRPPRNRVPEPVERETCGPFLERQLEIVQPEVIVTLGATAASYLLQRELSVGRIRGRFHRYGQAALMPTYHPAYLLRTPEAKRPVWEDMKMVREKLGLTR